MRVAYLRRGNLARGPRPTAATQGHYLSESKCIAGLIVKYE